MTLFVDPPADDAEAKEVLSEAYKEVVTDLANYAGDFNHPNLFALGIAQAIALMESNYGKWGPNNASNNWGAVTATPNKDGSCPANAFQHGDSSFEAGQYQTCFVKFDTSLEGAVRFLQTLYGDRPTVFAAALAGDIRGVAQEMYRTSYYMGTAPHDQKDSNGDFTNVNNYIAFIGKGVDQIADLYPVGSGEPASNGVSGTAIAVIGVATLAGLMLMFKS